jgi:pimeloyl-ACP methyl ester carboxylesterase
MYDSAPDPRRTGVSAEGIVYERIGTGPPLLLVHGLGGTREIWQPQMSRLAEERDLIAVDMPGFGESRPLDEPASASALGEALIRLCGELGVSDPHIAGNSLGGWVALEMAKVGFASSLCLISPAGLWSRPLGKREREPHALAKALRPVVVSATRLRPLREAMLRTSLGHPTRVPADIGKRMIEAWIDAPAYASADREMRRDVFEEPERVEVPTTVVWGELDRLVKPPKPERCPPGTRILRVPGLGHTPNWDDPELVARLMLEASDVGG